MEAIGQIRYYEDGSPKNFHPVNNQLCSKSALYSGTAFRSIIPIIQLGIQTIPGAKIYINNSRNPIIIGSTGIYELSTEGATTITKLSIDKDTLTQIDSIPSAYLIIDFITERSL